MDAVKVSVILTTYNHAQYIRQALESILTQKTEFPIEVIVHDDASTDGTSEIIREYAAKDPERVIPVIQPENIYRKKLNVYRQFLLPIVRGRYVANLEGDDYWTDENKLQRQAEFLDAHPDYGTVVHNTRRIICNTGETDLINADEVERDIVLQDILENGDHSFHINSVMYRKEIRDQEPAFMEIPRGLFGDLSMRLLFINSGKIRYFPEIMSAYRYMAGGSFSVRTRDAEKRKKILDTIAELYQAVDEYQGYENHELFERYILENRYKACEYAGDYAALLKPPYDRILKTKDMPEQVKTRLKARFGGLYSCYETFRDRKKDQ